MTKRVFVFEQPVTTKGERPQLIAFPEDKIQFFESQRGSENCFLSINGLTVVGSFDDLVKQLGTRIDL